MTEANEDPSAKASSFQRGLLKMLLVFFLVWAIDLVVISLFTGKVRIWFPQWIDPASGHSPDSPVIYSQSYIAGICLIPYLCFLLDRAFLAGRRSGAVRAAAWGGAALVSGFVGWWKGGLMIEFGKEREALGWVSLTALTWLAVTLAQRVPTWAARMTRRAMLRGLVLALATFFLVMGIADPVIITGVHHLPWSAGLVIEMGFFLPAGFALAVLSIRLRNLSRA